VRLRQDSNLQPRD